MAKKNTKKPQEVPEAEVQRERSESDSKEIRVIERIIENNEVAPHDAFGKLTRGQVDLIKRTIAKDASDDELRLFLQVCKGAQLNPFLKQAHLVPYWDSKEGQWRRAIIVGIDGFRSVAESSGAYAGNEDPIYDGEHEVTYEQDKQTKKFQAPLKATVTVYKIVDGQRYPFTATARWSEYYPGEKKGFQWRIRPYFMLGKCAEGLALRKAFPKLLSGMYVQEEMDQALQGPTEEEKSAKAFDTLKKAIGSATIPQLESYKKKMAASEKYNAAQKKEFNKMVADRIKELQPKKLNAAKPAAEEKDAPAGDDFIDEHADS